MTDLTLPTALTLIAAVAAAVVSIINAIAAGWGRKAAKDAVLEAKEARAAAGEKLDVIHDLTNGTMTRLKTDLAAALLRIDKLEGLLAETRPQGDGQL